MTNGFHVEAGAAETKSKKPEKKSTEPAKTQATTKPKRAKKEPTTKG